MDFTKAQIAGLVLGYLKSEKCSSAYEVFLKNSAHLTEAQQLLQKGKYVVTRFHGMNLEGILHEFAKIYTTVQGYLEASDYYEGNHHPNSLSDQIIYLLEKDSIPVTSSPISREGTRTEKPNVSDRATNTVECDLNTTPSSSLPGNIDDDDNLNSKRSRRKDACNSKLHKSADDDPPSPLADEAVNMILSQTLLDNRELHEKLAENINIVRGTPEVMSTTTRSQTKDEDVGDTAAKELDAEILKAIMERTEEQPIYTQVLNEVMGLAEEISKKKHPISENSNSIKPSSLDISEKSNTVGPNVNPNIDEINNDAVQSIIAVCNSTKTTGTTEHSKSCSNNVSHSEVTVFNGSLDNFLKTANAATIVPPNQLYLNQGSLYVVPPAVTGPPAGQTTQHFYVLNSQPVLNMNMQPITTAPIIAEQDIMAMPTVIINEDMTSSVVLAGTTGTTAKQTRPRTNVKIAPALPPRLKDRVGAKNRAEQITLYNETTKAEISTAPVTRSKSSTSSMPSIALEDPKTENDANKKKSSSKKKTEPSHSRRTPDAKQNFKSKTAKSGSHVRNLDFSSPSKSGSRRRDLRSARVRRNVVRKGTSKNLFRSKAQKSESIDLLSWDSDLRALAGVSDEKSKNSPAKAETHKTKQTQMEIEEKDTTTLLNTTHDEALMLEAALITPVRKDSPVKTTINDSKKNTVKKNLDNVMFPKDTNRQDELEEGECEEEEESEESRIPVKVDDDVQMKYSLRNCNNGPNFKKKCNLNPSNSKKSKIAPNRTKTERHSIDETASKRMLLSPSKLNASKRNIVKSDNLENSPEVNPTETTSESSEEITEARRHLSPILETPIKHMIPKTPSIHNSSGMLDTPFTKELEEQLKGVDLITMPTPKVPITPGFGLTPFADLLSYPNRPTDYSNSSSYYQPSDPEQNKSLEQILIEESERVHKRDKKVETSVKILSNVVIESGEENKGENISESANRPTEHVSDTGKKLAEHLKNFNQNVIGRKNLNLVKQSTTSSSSEGETSSSDSSDSESSCDDSSCAEQNSEIKDDKSCVYSLRNRTAAVRTETTEKTERTEEIEPAPVKSANELEKDVAKEKIMDNKNLKMSQKMILLEMEEKRKRMIDKFKSNTSSTITTSKPAVTKSKRKPLAPKLVKQKQQTKTLKAPARKKPSPIKQNKKLDTENIKEQIAHDKLVKKNELLAAETENTDEDIVLHLSSDDENDRTLRASQLVETQLLEYSNSPQTDANTESSFAVLKEHDKDNIDHSRKVDKRLTEHITKEIDKDVDKTSTEVSVIDETIIEGSVEETIKHILETTTEDFVKEPNKDIVNPPIEDSVKEVNNIDETVDKDSLKDKNKTIDDTVAKDTSKDKENKTIDDTATKDSLRDKNKNIDSRVIKDSMKWKKRTIAKTIREDSEKKESKHVSRTKTIKDTAEHSEKNESKHVSKTKTVDKDSLKKKKKNIDRTVTDNSVKKNYTTVNKTVIENTVEENDSEGCNQDAEKLVSELKERGIHLMHKKSPVKRDKISENILDVIKQDKIDALDTKLKLYFSEKVDDNRKNKILEESSHKKKDSKDEGDKAGKHNKKKTCDKIADKTEHIKRATEKPTRKEDDARQETDDSQHKDGSNKIETNIEPQKNTSTCDLETSFNSGTDVIFDLKLYENEDFSFVYDDSEKHKTIKDYDLDLLNRHVTANVYLEELDQEMDRTIDCSLFVSLIDIPSKDILLLKRKRHFDVPKDKTCLDRSKKDKTPHGACDKSETSKSENKSDAHSVVLTDSRRNSIEVKRVESCKIDSVTNSEIQTSTSVVENIEIVNGMIFPNSEGDLELAEYDAMMNYAIVGSEREENPEDLTASPKSGKKRKVSNGEEEKNPEKKIKTEQCKKLIKNIDVDQFLNKVHGENLL